MEKGDILNNGARVLDVSGDHSLVLAEWPREHKTEYVVWDIGVNDQTICGRYFDMPEKADEVFQKLKNRV